MAVFQFGGHQLPYFTQFAPFAENLVLLQDSRFDAGFWAPFLDEIGDQPRLGKRVLTLDWPAVPAEERPRFFLRLMRTLGMAPVHAVAMGDAVGLVAEMRALEPEVFSGVLENPPGAPKKLIHALRDFHD